MPEKPTINVQLIHIEGPLKGKIDETTDAVMHIGRHPDCQVRFPKDITVVSRNHADIVRDGNRFKVVDHSTNGTFINGKPVTEAILKNGDVLMIGDGGPKVSFLSEIRSDLNHAPSTEPSHLPPKPSVSGRGAGLNLPDRPAASLSQNPDPGDSNRVGVPSVPTAPKPNIDAADARVQAPLAIQFGPTIQSFKMLPVIVGKGSGCDFVIDHAHIIDRHLQIFFFESNYWIKDLTGQGGIAINDTPVRGQSPLHPGSRLALSSQGPVFQFLSGGRLAEVADSSIHAASEKSAPTPETPFGAISTPTSRSRAPLWFFIGFLAILIVVGILFFLVTDTSELSMFKGLKSWWVQVVETIRGLVK